MILEMEMSEALLEAFLQEIRTERLPVHIQRSFPYTDENGTEMENVIIEHPDTGFDFNETLSRVVNKFILQQQEPAHNEPQRHAQSASK